jgi:hypothetical protein
MSIEAMKQARNLLLAYQNMGDFRIANDCFTTVHTLTKAIEQAEKQEPVAWMTNSEHEYSIEYKFNWLQTPLHDIPLYTAPPRKEWVWLTDDEIKNILDCGREGLIDIKKAEQILKDKNT